MAVESTSLSTHSVDVDSIRRLLLIRLRSLGDTVLMTPVLSALKRWRADLQISVLLERRFAEVLQGNPHVTDLILLENDRPGFLANARHRLSLMRALRQRPYDAILNLHGGTTSLLFTQLLPARYKMGFSSYRYSQFYNVIIPESRLVWHRDRVHTVENQLAPLKWLGVPLPEVADLELFVAGESRRHMRARLREHGLLGNGFILIHPTATLFTKQWDLDKFGRLIECLAGQYDARVVVSVAPQEQRVAQEIRACTTRPFVIFDDLSLSDLIALIDEASLFIGCDSGPTHIAAALKKDIVAIFGSSNAVAWRPWNVRSEVLQSDLPCIPCPGYRCYEFSEPKCIKQISVEAVLSAVNRILVKEENER